MVALEKDSEFGLSVPQRTTTGAIRKKAGNHARQRVRDKSIAFHLLFVEAVLSLNSIISQGL
jgi:hypothetical protein